MCARISVAFQLVLACSPWATCRSQYAKDKRWYCGTGFEEELSSLLHQTMEAGPLQQYPSLLPGPPAMEAFHRLMMSTLRSSDWQTAAHLALWCAPSHKVAAQHGLTSALEQDGKAGLWADGRSACWIADCAAIPGEFACGLAGVCGHFKERCKKGALALPPTKPKSFQQTEFDVGGSCEMTMESTCLCWPSCLLLCRCMSCRQHYAAFCCRCI